MVTSKIPTKEEGRGTTLIRPDVAPAPSDTVLVTTYLFKSDGEANAIIDPMGLATRWNNNNAGRRIWLADAGSPARYDASHGSTII